MPDPQHLTFALKWSGAEEATLTRLTYNDVPVLSTPVAGSGGVSHPFSAPAAATHRFSWTLLFPGKTLRNLEATAAIGAGEGMPVGASGEETNRWVETGLAEEGG